ncbi:MAG: VWA domain-containing protein [Planctomycetota bacterium]
MTAISNDERLRRWRLVLGKPAQPSGAGAKGARPGSETGDDGGGEGLGLELHGDDAQMDNVLEALYGGQRAAGLGSSCPNVNRWLGDIRTYFPKSVVQVMQKDALERLNLHQMLLEPETLESVEADVHLIGTLLSLKNVIPKKTKETARNVVRKVVSELERKLRNPMTEAVRGALNKATRTSRPRAAEIDWHRTIRKNLHNYIPDRGTIIAERLVGYGRKRSSLRDIVLCIDQSGSMATSIVYSSVFGAVLASLRAVTTKMVVFDTEVVDLTEHLSDPVDVLFGTQLGGGTDINRAVGYCQQLMTRPSQTIFVLISDLIEGGVEEQLLRRTAEIVGAGATMICLLALSDDGAPCYDERLAARMSALGAPSFACTPDLFPDLMAHAIQKRDIATWAARHEIVVRA